MTSIALTHDQVRATLPHRYPMLLVDKVLSISDDGRELIAVKNITADEPFFPGHFPGRPVMPGVLMIEALAQAAGLLFYHRNPETQGWDVFLVGVDKFRFRRPVVPGDVLTLTITLKRDAAPTRPWTFHALGSVDGERALEGEVSAMVIEPDGRTEST